MQQLLFMENHLTSPKTFILSIQQTMKCLLGVRHCAGPKEYKDIDTGGFDLGTQTNNRLQQRPRWDAQGATEAQGSMSTLTWMVREIRPASCSLKQ